MRTASECGFPSIPSFTTPIEGQPIAWIPGVKPNVHDWRLLLWHSGDLRRYIESGGDMDHAVIHWLSRDDGCIEPLWGKETFRRRVKQMRQANIQYVIGPDFSSWADMPIATQLHNYYRSAVVAHDLAKCGFKVIPNVCWSAPQLHEISIGMWGVGLAFALIDANHFSPRRQNYNYDLFWDGAEQFSIRNPDAFCWVYSSYREVADMWMARNGPCVWCPSRVAVLNKLRKHIKKVRNGQRNLW